MTTGILLVDDQELMRMGFRMVIDSQADLAVVGEASNGREAVEVIQRLEPDVVLMDVRMPEMDGVEATRLIVESESETRIIILTTFDLDEYVYAALRAGASGFLLKDTPPADLLSAIRAVANGDAVVAPRVTRRLLSTYSHRLPSPTETDAGGRQRLEQLTAREYEVLLQVARSLSNAEIAEQLMLSEATVKSHVGRILSKLHLRDRVQIVVFAYKTGLITPRSNVSGHALYHLLRAHPRAGSATIIRGSRPRSRGSAGRRVCPLRKGWPPVSALGIRGRRPAKGAATGARQPPMWAAPSCLGSGRLAARGGRARAGA